MNIKWDAIVVLAIGAGITYFVYKHRPIFAWITGIVTVLAVFHLWKR